MTADSMIVSVGGSRTSRAATHIAWSSGHVRVGWLRRSFLPASAGNGVRAELTRALQILSLLILAAGSAWFVVVFMATAPPAGVPHLFDFHTFWQAGRAYAHGRNPYPGRIDGSIGHADWFVYPAPVAAAFAPIGLLPYGVAWIAFGVLLVGSVAASLWLCGVRDWRCYAIAFCALPVLKALNLGTVTPLLMLGTAATWRLRNHRKALAVAVGAIVLTKLFLWLLLPWLWFTGRRRAALLSVAGAASLTALAWLPLGVSTATRYPSLLHQLALLEAPAGYGVGGIAAALGAGGRLIAALPLLVAPIAIGAVWLGTRALPEARSFALTIAVAVAISPVVWQHYFALAFICLALVSPSFSLAWFLPLAYWLTPSQQAWGTAWKIGLALAILAACVLPAPELVTLRYRSAGERLGRWSGSAPGLVRDLLEREAFIVAILALVVAIPLATMSVWVVQDTWLALVDGRLIAHHWLPHTDTLTRWTLGRPWIDQQWAAHLALYALAATFGLKAVVGFAIALSALALGVLAIGARRLGASPRSTAFGLLIPVLASPWFLQIRSQSLALVPFAAVYVLLAVDSRRPSRHVLFVIPVLALWANLHGSVALGVALVVLYALSLLRRPAYRLRGLLLAVSAPLCLVASPYGFALVGYYRLMLFHPPLAGFVKEWQPASLSPTTALFFISAFAMTALYARHRDTLTRFELWALPLLLLAALLAVRNAVWFELATVVAFPRLLEAGWPHRAALTPQLRRLNLSIALSSVLLLFVLATIELAQPEQTLHPGRTSSTANAVAQAAGAHGTVIADDANADWLLWAAPSLAGRVAYDVRFELYTKPELEKLKAFDDQSPAAWQACATGALVVTFASPSSAARARSRQLLAHGSSVIAKTASFVAVRQPANHQPDGEGSATLCGSRSPAT